MQSKEGNEGENTSEINSWLRPALAIPVSVLFVLVYSTQTVENWATL